MCVTQGWERGGTDCCTTADGSRPQIEFLERLQSDVEISPSDFSLFDYHSTRRRKDLIRN